MERKLVRRGLIYRAETVEPPPAYTGGPVRVICSHGHAARLIAADVTVAAGPLLCTCGRYVAQEALQGLPVVHGEVDLASYPVGPTR